MFDFGPDRTRRKPSLTPMIDVVFLLLVFFMLASRFGSDGAMPLVLASEGAAPWQGPPRLVEVRHGAVSLNGMTIAPDTLALALAPLMAAPDDTVILRARDGAPVQALVDVMETLKAAGITRLVLVE